MFSSNENKSKVEGRKSKVEGRKSKVGGFNLRHSTFNLVALCLLICSFPRQAKATIAFVSASSTACVNSSSSTSSLTCTLAASTAANHTVIVAIAIRTQTSTVSTVADSGTSSYSQCSGCVINSGTTTREEVWTTAVNASKASTTVTVTLSAGSKFVMSVEEYSGVSTLGNTNTLNNGSGTSTICSATVTTQDNNNWAVAGCAAAGTATYSANAGNIRANGVSSGGSGASNIGGAALDVSQSSPGTATMQATLSAGEVWASVALELRSGAAAACANLISLLGAGCK